MKILIRGERRTGKTCLMRRLQGLSFQEAYTPTCEIETAHVQWSYKASDEIVKLEAWDVVDKAQKSLNRETFAGNDEDRVAGAPIARTRSPSTSWDETLKIPGSHKIGLLDATTIDVYKHASAVVFSHRSYAEIDM